MEVRSLRKSIPAVAVAVVLLGAPVARGETADLVVAVDGTAWTASSNGQLIKRVATGGVRGVAVSPGGTLWLATTPSALELTSLNPDDGPGMCGFTALSWPWPEAEVDISQTGATWPAKMLLDAAHWQAPTCSIAATPDGDLAYTRMPAGSGTASLRFTPSSDPAHFHISPLGCGWDVTFSYSGGPAACLYHVRMAWGSMGDRVFTGAIPKVRGASSPKRWASGAGISPDGRDVIFTYTDGAIYFARASGRSARRLGTIRDAWGRVAWALNGSAFFVLAKGTVWKMTPFGRRPPKRVLAGVDALAVLPAGITP